MTVMIEDKFTRMKMPDFGRYESVRHVSLPRAYIFNKNDQTCVVIEKLRAHGVVVEELTAAAKLDVESFLVGDVKRAARPFQGHRTVKLSGTTRNDAIEFPPGSFVVRAAQPLARLAACLLEAESEDGLVAWNFLDPALVAGRPYPIYKFRGELRAAARVVE